MADGNIKNLPISVKCSIKGFSGSLISNQDSKLKNSKLIELIWWTKMLRVVRFQ